MTARAKAVCEPCRIAHLKCDQATPKCGRCQELRLQCKRGPGFRPYKRSFTGGQKWLSPPRDLTFVDETPSLNNNDYESESENGEPSEEAPPEYTQTSTSQFTQDEASHSPFDDHQSLRSGTASLPPLATLSWEQPSTSTFEPHHQVSLPRIPGLPHHDFTQLPSPVPSTPRAILNHDTSTHTYHEDHNTFRDPVSSISLPSIYLDKPVWPLTDPQEARLLRHFVQNLAIWLDLCDPAQHFQVEVPLRAGTCPILLNAIFALSARHLNLTGDYDSFASNRYHQECLKYLIPMLNSAATVTDETLFAATIVLRVLEEIDLLETDLQSHMLGIQIFVNSLFRPSTQPSPLHPSPPSSHPPLSNSSSQNSLATASFWVGLRQEIYMATILHRSVQINLEHCVVDRSTSPTSDFSWANRAVVLCADVLNCCFGVEGVGLGRWEELRNGCERWEDEKPSSFTPIFYREGRKEGIGEGREEGREAFPEIWHSHACHIIGVQHHKLAQILLCIFDPKIPRIGGSRNVAVRNMEAQIKPTLRQLCGIGLYNRWTPPGMFTASMGIAICGDRFEDRFDQEALLDILVRTERDHARPTAAVQKQLKEAWGWVDE